ncbi:MAG: hypothetical protein IKS19_06095 [Clostridia bacterium]|nr:hypothetical protein [Clostridia bacterium]
MPRPRKGEQTASGKGRQPKKADGPNMSRQLQRSKRIANTEEGILPVSHSPSVKSVAGNETRGSVI